MTTLLANTHVASAQSGCPNTMTLNRGGDEQIHGRSLLDIVASLRDRGIHVVNVEAQAQLIRVDVVDADCSTHSELLDPDTLQPVAEHWQH